MLTRNRSIGTDTIDALQIIQTESHPNIFNQGPGVSGTKESLSIYGLFHHLARTPQGKARLRQYFLRPSLDLEEINARLDFISEFVRPDNRITAEKLSKSLSRIKNMKTVMVFLRKGINYNNKRLGGFKSGVWATLLEFCYHTIDVADTMKETTGAENLEILFRIRHVLDHFHLQRIGKMINDIVDLELSAEQHRTVVKYGVNNDLDRIKEMYDGMDILLSQAARKIAASVRGNVNLNVIFFPQLGFHIAVPVDAITGQPVCSGPEWERRFTTDDLVYFKDAITQDLDEELGDIFATICDLEIEISYDLAQRVLADEKLLIDVSELCGELDSLLALAHGAVQHNLVRPRLTEQNCVEIKGGRHLLQEMTVASFVPNDTFLSGGAESHGPAMTILTGPNYSGKSVYLKQVALTVYLAHVGSFVAAESATIGLTDKILTRISTRETVSKMQSAFMIDLQQVAHAMNQCTNRSLIIIDEFGKGTESCDGAGLTAAMFEYFFNLGPKSPRLLAATHFHEIFENHLDFPSIVGFGHMEVRVDKRGKRKANQCEVTYLYNLKPGRSNMSYGTQCAAMNGMPSEVVKRAAELAEIWSQGGDLVGILASISPAEVDDLEGAEGIARAFLAHDLSSVEETDSMAMLEELLRERTMEKSTDLIELQPSLCSGPSCNIAKDN